MTTTIDSLEIPLLQFAEAAAPSTPAAGLVRIYAKADGKLYSKDDAGAETELGPGSGGIPATIFDAKGDIIAASAADTATRLAVGANNLALIAASGETTGLKWAHPVLSFVSDQLTGDVALTSANTYYDGPSVSLVAGTWIVVCSIHVFNNNASAQGLSAKLWDGTTVIGSGNQSANNAFAVQFALVGIATPGSTTTYKVSAASSGTDGSIKAQMVNNAAGNTASTIVAVRIA